jgi:hypothetical protein
MIVSGSHRPPREHFPGIHGYRFLAKKNISRILFALPGLQTHNADMVAPFEFKVNINTTENIEPVDADGICMSAKQ